MVDWWDRTEAIIHRRALYRTTVITLIASVAIMFCRHTGSDARLSTCAYINLVSTAKAGVPLHASRADSQRGKGEDGVAAEASRPRGTTAAWASQEGRRLPGRQCGAACHTHEYMIILASCTPCAWQCGASATHVYQYAEVGRVQTEMVRPSVAGTVGGKPFGGFNYEKMRMAGVARSIQSRLAMHSCTTRYCLEGRSSCRFFFPWPESSSCACAGSIASFAHPVCLS